MASKEQAADALEAGAWHSVEMKGGWRKLHIAKFKICVTYQIPGHAEAQLVETHRYKPEGRRFDSSRCY